MKNTDNKQEHYVYGSIGGSIVALVPKPAEKPVEVAAPSPADTLSRDYEFAERIGTRQAWESFLAAHSTGFFADLARAARDKIIAAEERVTLGKEKAAEEETKRKAAEAARVRAAEEARLKAEAEAKKVAEEEAKRRVYEEARYRAAEEAKLKAEEAARKLAEEDAKLKARLEAVAKSQQAPMVVASAPATEAAPNSLPKMDPADVARLLQFHLKRVGCDPGALDGKWTDQSARAMEEFNKREKANFDVKIASIGALDAVKQQKARVCPLVCGKGFKAEEDRCVAITCQRGFVRNKDGGCERETKSAARPATREGNGGANNAGGQIFCGRQGCSAVPKNCRIVAVANTHGTNASVGSSAGQAVVCN
jgi:hypothetical protein